MTSTQTNHPLPAPPGPHQYQGQYQQDYERPQRPRSKSSFSFRSTKSHKSSGSNGHIDLHETHWEKEARRLSTKADPTLAMNEAEPAAVASGVASKLAPLRAVQHRDASGLPIADPDRSNPTRSRWERPLDTIRSFEAAIDGNYTKKAFGRTESSDSVAAVNRRSSYFEGSNGGAMASRFPTNSYYGWRGPSFRPEGFAEEGYSRPGSYYDNGNYSPGNGPSNGYYPNRSRYPRTASEPVINNGTGMYPNHNQQSYETVNSASGSGSSGEPIGYMTDPSSENSSIDRFQGAEAHRFNGGPKPSQSYGSNAYGGYNPETVANNGNYGQNSGPPPPPKKESYAEAPRVPIKLGSSTGGPTVYEAPRPGGGEKRKSWFGKKFGKS